MYAAKAQQNQQQQQHQQSTTSTGDATDSIASSSMVSTHMSAQVSPKGECPCKLILWINNVTLCAPVLTEVIRSFFRWPTPPFTNDKSPWWSLLLATSTTTTTTAATTAATTTTTTTTSAGFFRSWLCSMFQSYFVHFDSLISFSCKHNDFN